MKIALCDDHKENIMSYADILVRICRKHRIELEIDPYISGSQMLFELEDSKKHPDLIYLDVDMPGQDGFATARQLREQGYGSEILFLTSCSTADTILKAFDVRAFHYIVRDETSLERSEEIFLQVYERCRKKSRETLIFSCAGETRKVFVEEIKYFEARDHYITVYYGADAFEFYSTFGKIENMLYGHGFLRTHRSFIVARDKIMQISRNQIELRSGETIPVGRAYIKAVKRAWEPLTEPG